MKNKIKAIAGSIVSMAILVVGERAVAVEAWAPGVGVTKTSSITTIVDNAITFALYAAGIVSVGYILMGGFSYLTSSGNAEKVGNANKTIAYAIVGMIIIALAFAIKSFVMTKLLTNVAGADAINAAN